MKQHVYGMLQLPSVKTYNTTWTVLTQAKLQIGTAKELHEISWDETNTRWVAIDEEIL